MLTMLIKYITPNYEKLKGTTVFLILFLTSFFLRLPFFFRDYIDRDESTFILMGQSMVDGYLPYMELWDVKPPLIFLFFAGIIAVFGKSFIAIRLVAVLVVAITSFFSFKITEKLSSKKVSLWVGIFAVFLQSALGSLQGLMSEQVCMLFLMFGLFILMYYSKAYHYLAAGLFLGIAVMIKLNMAFTLLFVGLYLLYDAFQKKEFTKGMLRAFLYGTGIISIILLTIAPYYFIGEADLWWRSVVEAPLKYTDARRNAAFKLLPPFLVITAFFVAIWKVKLVNFKDTKIQLLFVAILGVLVSYYKGGRINGHYLIHLYPLLLIFAGIAVSKMKLFHRFNYAPYVIFALFLAPSEAYLEYFRIAKHQMEKGSFYNGEGIEVPKYIRENNLEYRNILFTEYHIGYWILDTKPPTKAATHPSNLSKEEMFFAYANPRENTMEEIRFILEEKKLSLIVAQKGQLLLHDTFIKENIYVNAYLKKHYRTLKTIGQAVIFQRLKG